MWMMGKLLKTTSSSTARPIHQLEPLLCFHFSLGGSYVRWAHAVGEQQKRYARSLSVAPAHAQTSADLLGSPTPDNNTIHLNDQSQTWGGLHWLCSQQTFFHVEVGGFAIAIKQCLWSWVTFRLEFTPPLGQTPQSLFLIPCDWGSYTKMHQGVDNPDLTDLCPCWQCMQMSSQWWASFWFFFCMSGQKQMPSGLRAHWLQRRVNKRAGKG